MGISDLLYRPEAVTFVVGVGAFVVIGRSLLVYQHASDQLWVTLERLDQEIRDCQKAIPGARQRVQELEMVVRPLKDKLRMLNLYYDQITAISLAAERKEVQDEKSNTSRGSVEAAAIGRRPEG